MELKKTKKAKDKIIKKARKPKTVDFSKILEIDMSQVDRISGGMMRLEHKYRNWTAYINHCLKLAKILKRRC